MDNSHLQRIEEFLRQRSALCFAGRRHGTLRFYIQERVAALGLSGVAKYEELLRESAEEQARLYDLVTVNETSFFRNPLQFDDLANRIIPPLEEERGRRLARHWGCGGEREPSSFRRLRVLSAGCSTGEEPYSLAITLLSALRYPLAWDLEVLAADISESCLEFAARGRYPEARLRGIPPHHRERFLRRDGAEWEMREEVKRVVRFAPVNLAQVMAGDPFPGLPAGFEGFDVIFCRNVMIYFPSASQQLLIDALQRLLAPGGYLFTGDAEPLHLYRHELQTVTGVQSLIYRKKGEEAPALPSPQGDPLAGYAVEELLRLVADSSLGLRAEALQRLLRRNFHELAPVLERGVREESDAEFRNGAMEVLVACAEKSLPLLCSLLRDEDLEVRNFAAVMMGSIGSSLVVPQLIRALKDPELNVRHAAAEALGKIGDPLSLDALLELLDDGFWLQFAAIKALGDLGNAAAVPRLVLLLEDELLFEPVTQALQKIGGRSALPALRAISRSPDLRRARMAAQTAAVIEQNQDQGIRLMRGA